VIVPGSGNTLIFGQHVVAEGTHTTASSHTTFYSQHMAKHGTFYWVLHGVVALIVALIASAIWEYSPRLFGK
jgi:uncharacterized membrane protein